MNTSAAVGQPIEFVQRLREEAHTPIEPVTASEVKKETQIIAIYGKGGIGKSFTLANLSSSCSVCAKKPTPRSSR